MIRIPGGSNRLISVDISGFKTPQIFSTGFMQTVADVEFHIIASDKVFHGSIECGKFVWNGASIPKIFQKIVGNPTDEEFRIGSLVHDFLYEKRFDRQLADDVLYHLLDQDSRVPGWKLRLMFWAVRLGGFVIYASDTNRFWKRVRRGFF